jgi:hypothetical protein
LAGFAGQTYIAIEVLGNLLKGSVAGLDVEEVNDDQLDRKPDVVHDVVLPFDVTQSDRVDILVAARVVSNVRLDCDAMDLQEESNVDHQEHESHALGANAVGQDFCRVTHKKTRPGQVVEAVVEENHGHHSVCSTLVGVVHAVRSRATGPDDENNEHAGGGDKEQWTSADLVDEEAHAGGDDHVQDLQTSVNNELDVAVRDSDIVENDVQVVADKTVARPLREETERQEDDEPVAVALGLEELEPAVAFELLLQLDSVLNLLELDLHNLRLEIAVCVHLCEDSVSFLDLAVCNEETRGLWHKPDERDLEERRQCLHQGGYTPAPVVVLRRVSKQLEAHQSSWDRLTDVVCAEGQPSCDETSNVPCRVVDCSESGAVLRVYKLSDEKRRGTVSNRDAETDEEPRGDKHLQVDRDRLENDTKDHSDTANHDTPSSS